MRSILLGCFFALACVVSVPPLGYAAEEACLYRDAEGVWRRAESKRKVPPRFRSSATCTAINQQSRLARPDEVELEGAERREDMASSVGRVQLRWPRAVEKMFHRTPRRAMADAARTMSRTLRQNGFPAKTRSLDLPWEVVFLGKEMQAGQVPFYLISNCHPGWMTPPSNIYIVAERVAAGCGRSTPHRNGVADSELTEVLLHEMGHALEYSLLGPLFGTERMRAEGFATWWTSFAASKSALLRGSGLEKKQRELAKAAWGGRAGPFTFRGSGEDYARAAMYFHAIVERRGVRGLMEVYEGITSRRIPFLQAVDEELHWDSERLHKEVERLW